MPERCAEKSADPPADPAAFEQFVRANSATLYRTAFLLTGNGHDAEELLQDTLTNLYPKWSQVQRAESEIAYVRRAVANRFVSLRRKPANRFASRWELPDRWDGRDLSESVALSGTIWQMLGELPERQRAAVVLRYFHDLPDEQIAAALGCQRATVRSLVNRGLGSLRSAYVRTGEEAS